MSDKCSVDITHYELKPDGDNECIGSKYWKFDTYDEAFKYLESEVEKYQKDEAAKVKASTKHSLKVYRQRENKWILTILNLNYIGGEEE